MILGIFMYTCKLCTYILVVYTVCMSRCLLGCDLYLDVELLRTCTGSLQSFRRTSKDTYGRVSNRVSSSLCNYGDEKTCMHVYDTASTCLVIHLGFYMQRMPNQAYACTCRSHF
jgi:hypothetical protein